MHEAVEQLARILPGPHRSEAKNWSAVESALGTGLPADYKEFIEAIGGGYLDGYLYVLEPDCPNVHYDLAETSEERADAFEYLWDGGEERPDELNDTGARLIPFATTDNGEFLFWLARPGQDADEWTVMVNEARGDWWERFDLTFVPFLLGVLTGALRSDILSSGFPSTPSTFESFNLLG
ncbi:SMI1/KNR4 family protein [Kitasatospora sp. NPDC086009]|uniref:SMI1/KNR4 family protein n=1 Tax=unclassified Kitasatospora TaxID=2633591 RepID=UPI0037C780AB